MISPRGRGNDGDGEVGESAMSLGVHLFTDRDSTDRCKIKSDIDHFIIEFSEGAVGFVDRIDHSKFFIRGDFSRTTGPRSMAPQNSRSRVAREPEIAIPTCIPRHRCFRSHWTMSGGRSVLRVALLRPDPPSSPTIRRSPMCRRHVVGGEVLVPVINGSNGLAVPISNSLSRSLP